MESRKDLLVILDTTPCSTGKKKLQKKTIPNSSERLRGSKKLKHVFTSDDLKHQEVARTMY